MTTLREAAQQALEALHEIAWSNDSRWQTDRAESVIPALRDALAQQPQTPCAIAEDGVCEVIDCCRNPAQQEQEQEQEPHWLTKELMADYLDMVAEALEENRSEMLRHKAHWMRKRGEV